MAGFGKRETMGTGRSERVGGASKAARPRTGHPLAASLSQQEIADLDQGKLPSWTEMGLRWVIGFVVVLPLLVAYSCLHWGSGLVRDIRYAGSFVEAPELRQIEGECTRYQLLLTDCNVKFQSIGAGAAEHTIVFAEFFRFSSTTPIVPVRSTIDPSVVSVEYAVGSLWSRALSLVGFNVMILMVWWTQFRFLLRGHYQGSKAHDAIRQYAQLPA